MKKILSLLAVAAVALTLTASALAGSFEDGWTWDETTYVVEGA